MYSVCMQMVPQNSARKRSEARAGHLSSFALTFGAECINFFNDAV